MEPTTRPNRICVLGGGGFLGSHLVTALLRDPAVQVHAIDLSFARLEASSPRLELTQASIAEAGVLDRAVALADVVVSTTALCTPALYNTRPVDVIHASFTHLVPLVELCTARRRRLIHFSTCEVYGTGAAPPGPDAPLCEASSALVLGAVQHERWSYACAKQLLERLIWGHGAHHGLEFTIVRPFNVIGPRMDFLPGVDGEGTPRVLACFMQRLLQAQPLQLVDGGTRRRSFLYVDDFVDGVVRIVDLPAACRGAIVNLGNPANDVTIADFARRMVAVYRGLTGTAPSPPLVTVDAAEFYGPGYQDTERRVPDIGVARRLLEWSPATALDEMLPPIVADYLARYGAPAAVAAPRVAPAAS